MEEDLKGISHKFAACQSQLFTLTVAKQELELKLRQTEDRLRAQILDHEQDLKDSKADIEYLSKQNADLRKAVSEYECKIENRDTGSEDRLRALTEEYEKNLNIIASQESYIVQVESQNITFADQIEKLEENNARLENKKKSLTEENNLLRFKNKELIESLEKVTREAEKIISEHVKREESRKNQQDEYMAIVKKHSLLEKKYKEVSQNYEKFEKEMVSKNDRINSIRNSKLIIENKLKDEEKKNEDLIKRLKIFENSVKYQKKIDSSEISQVQVEQDLKLAESERKLKALFDKIDPLIKRNTQLEKVIEK